ncbi:MAG: long-chain fatty acid--CoA ligase [Gemmatimonadales bacterium]|nr:long-chain fatty acid--CoA ligase [Gemmatimonadales bacterium]
MERVWYKQYDDGVPQDLPASERTVVDAFYASAAKWPDQPALSLKGKTLTYAHLQDQIDRFATGLSRMGVVKDSKVALWLPNLPQMVIAFYATLKLGAQAVTTNPMYVEREIEHQFNDAGVNVVVTLDYLWWYKLRGILDKTPVKNVVVTSIPDYLPFPLNLLAPLKLKKTKQFVKVPKEEGVHFFKEIIKQSPPNQDDVQVTPKDLALLQYTGGTTGVSKGAMLTHSNIETNARQCSVWFPAVVPGQEVLLACLPYFHVFGMTVSMNWPLSVGMHIVLAPNPRDIPDLIKSITKKKVTVFPAVPALFAAINEFPGVEKLDLSSIKGCFSGSAPLPLDVLERFEKITGGVITEGFGLTETSPVTHGNPLGGVRKPGTVGVPWPSTDSKIVDIQDGDTELGVNEEGELCIKGPQVMAGYWNRPSATAQTIRDGWVYTGDLAKADEDGYVTIVGRKKDMIVVSGFNVYPDEVDGVLISHPAVLETATIGLPDPKRGETVKAFVVLKPGQTATVEELREFCKKEMASYKVPWKIEFLDELPKSSMMKILRKDLRAKELAKDSD